MMSRSLGTLMPSLAVVVSTSCLISAPAKAAIAGVLDCDVTPGLGILIGAKRDVVCTYSQTSGGKESYAGTLMDAGLVLGELKSGKMVYNVYSLLRPEITDLEGSFIGGGIGGSVGFDKGLRADNLIGGPKNVIVLQPASETAAQAAGINFSAGVRTLSLTHSTTR